VGGDKVIPYFRAGAEENPALGWRAIRMALDRPALFRTQIRALLRAAQGCELRVMLPMISDVSELETARALIAKEFALLKKHGRPEPSKLKVGTMIEVPALLWQADRGNQRVADRFDNLSPAVLRVLRQIAQAAERHATPLTLCGEMAGRPLEAMALIGLGFRSISVAPASVGPIKAMVLSLDAGQLAERLDALLAGGETSLREDLKRFAAENGVQA
jgi:phosphotransferase system enzyme I (PtsP)